MHNTNYPYQVSVVVPAYNEAESLPELSDWVHRVCTQHQLTYEICFIDDGSKDRTWEVVEELAQNNPAVKGIKFKRNYGKSAALNEGFKKAQGEVIITMDADLQDSPEEIPGLRKRIVEEGFDLISGWKQKRYDPPSKTIPTKLFNAVTRKMSGIQLHDFNCGLKAYHYNVVKNIEVYGEMHRYIPVIAKWHGYGKIGEQVVAHQARKYGTSKFGLERFINGFLDLLTITFVSKFGKKPMHFFGTLGTLMFFIGLLSTGWLGVYKLYHLYHQQPARLITDQPQFYIALTTMVIGVQLFLAGFIAELVSRNALDRNQYNIEKEL
ncbi:MAG TPA: glycosyltransferase family 2 protein [Luteibaculaceae bacterium]|nr:glycosyltransferase family 2 protein [Luteibaculaceae bacterium]